MFTKPQVAEQLGVSIHTLTKWYEWESKLLKDGKITERYLPIPTKDYTKKGSPNTFSEEQIEQLKTYQSSIVHGRNGVYGGYSNPLHTQTKKYKKQMEEQNV